MSHDAVRAARRGFVRAGALVALAIAGCASPEGVTPAPGAASARADAIYTLAPADTAGLDRAIFAAGCFWCAETAFEGVAGVRAVISGYVGGPESHPRYAQVSAGETGHTEAVLVTYDPGVITYRRLLEIFWVNHDPTTADRQFCDHGPQYRPGIFPLDSAQASEARASVAWAKSRARFRDPILTEITMTTAFWPAEVYHQDFWKKNPVRYQTYRVGCGRDARLARLWGPPDTKH